jgi:hypothetical protein
LSRRRRAATSFAVVVLAAFALPALTAAKPHASRSLTVELDTRGSNGYKVSVFAYGPREVFLDVRKGGLSASYEVRGRITRDRLEASFGKLGKISLRFKRSSKTTETLESSDGCPPARITEEHGLFRGTLAFAGEQGYTRVNSHRVRGEVTLLARPPCSSERSATKSGRVTSGAAELSAVSRSKGRETDFSVVKYFPELDEWLFDAFVTEQRGRIDIERDAFAFAQSGSFLVSKPGVHPVSAEVIAPKPFQGTATFAEEPVSPALFWDGSLSVSLPGIGPVPLAGKGFEAFLCSEKNLSLLITCTEKQEGIDSLVQPARGSRAADIIPPRG